MLIGVGQYGAVGRRPNKVTEHLSAECPEEGVLILRLRREFFVALTRGMNRQIDGLGQQSATRPLTVVSGFIISRRPQTARNALEGLRNMATAA